MFFPMQQYFVMASWLSCLLGLRRPPVRRVPFRSLAFFSGSFTLKLGIATASVEALQRKCGKMPLLGEIVISCDSSHLSLAELLPILTVQLSFKPLRSHRPQHCQRFSGTWVQSRIVQHVQYGIPSSKIKWNVSKTIAESCRIINPCLDTVWEGHLTSWSLAVWLGQVGSTTTKSKAHGTSVQTKWSQNADTGVAGALAIASAVLLTPVSVLQGHWQELGIRTGEKRGVVTQAGPAIV